MMEAEGIKDKAQTGEALELHFTFAVRDPLKATSFSSSPVV